MKTIKNNTLYWDGCNTVEMAKKYGTPLYLMSENSIIDRCNEIKESFLNKYENTRAIFASKPFLPLAMCKIIEREGLGLDVVSGGELYTAITANFPLERVDFNGNNKSREELELAIEHEIGRCIVDNLYELELIEEICKEKNKKMSVLFRVVPGVTTGTHEYISTGHKNSKFGVSLEANIFFETLEKAISSEYIDFKGIHFHVGSQLHDNTSHLQAIDVAMDLILEIKEKYNVVVEDLDIGGGFGIYYTEADKPKPLSYFIDPSMEKIETFCKANNLHRPKIIIEPGRWVVGEAGITIYKAGSIKKAPSTSKYVSVDGGMADNIRPALYQAEYEALVANKAGDENVDMVSISGKYCESADILVKDIMLPVIESNDYIAIFSTGAYTFSMASNYNKNIIPAVVLLNNGRDEVIVKRQTYDDVIKNEVIPASLA